MLRSLLSLAVLVALSMVAIAAAPVEVPVGSELRKQLFALLRPKIAKIAKQEVKFQGSLKSTGDWAFFSGSTLDADGEQVEIGPAESSDTAALWRRSRGEWKLVEFSAGHTDVVYLDWPQKHGAPESLVGGEEEQGGGLGAAVSDKGAKQPNDLKKFLHSTKGTYGWSPVKGSGVSYDFFPDGRLHIQGQDGEATMWEGKWRLEGDQLTLTNSTLKRTQTVTAEADGAELLLDGKRYRRQR